MFFCAGGGRGGGGASIITFSFFVCLFVCSCLGILFYRLTGRKPFAGHDYKEILKANRDCKVDYEKEDVKRLNETSKTQSLIKF